MQENQCQELFMRDIVRIDFMPPEELKVGVPFNVPNITQVSVSMINNDSLTDARLKAKSLLSLSLSGDDTADAEMQPVLSNKESDKRETQGVMRTHALQIPIESGFDTIRAKKPSLLERDFCLVLKDAGENRYLIYSIPGGSLFATEAQEGQGASMTVKATIQSYSGIIKIM
jgi:hypothetical protein